MSRSLEDGDSTDAGQPPPSARSAGSSWFSGLFSGAGRILSSVFPSGNTSTTSSSYSSDEDNDNNSDQNVDTDVSSKEPDELKQIDKLGLVNASTGTSLAIISEIEPKHAIEQLLMQETFSRDEFNKLTNIIQSRVVDIPSAEVGEVGGQMNILHWWTDNVIAQKSLNEGGRLSEAIPYSFSSLNAFSPGSSGCQLLTSDKCNSVVMEAKEWLKWRRLSSSSKFDSEHDACTSITNALKYDLEGSPVDMAKSYMQSLPAWRSPSLSNMGLKTTPHTRKDLFNGGGPYSIANNSSSSPEVLKRKFFDFGSWDNLDETRGVRLKSTENVSDIFKSKETESSARCSSHEACKISSAAEENMHVDSSTLQAKESLDASASANLFSELCDKDHSLVGALKVPDKQAVEAIHSLRACNTTLPTLVSEADKTVLNERQATHGISSLTPLPPKPDSKIGNEPQSCDATVHIVDKSQDVEGPSRMKKQHGRKSVRCNSLILALPSVKHDVDHPDDPLKVEAKIMPLVKSKALASDTDAVTNISDVYISHIQINFGAEENSLHPKLVSGSRLQHGSGEMQNEANLLTNRAASGSSGQINTNANAGFKEKPNPTNFNNCEPATGISEGTHGLSSEAITGAPAAPISKCSRGRPRKVTITKSVKQLLTESEPYASDTQQREAAPRPRRGRGRGRGRRSN